MYRSLFAAALIAAAAAPAHADEPHLPAWFPMPNMVINSDQLQPEDYGHDDFKIENKKGDDYDTVTFYGHHWATSLYAPKDKDWNGAASWAVLKPALEKQGFAIVYLKQDDGSTDATFRKGTGDHVTYVEVHLSKDDSYSNNVHIVEVAPRTRKLVLVPPAAKPETLSDDKDFPYITPLPGSKLLTTKHLDEPMDVTVSADQEPHLVGTGKINKMYEGGLDGVSDEDFQATYANAFTAAGWTIVDKHRASVTAHYAKHGRDLWANVYTEGGGRWDADVADAGTGLRAELEHGCKAPLTGLRFDFNKATLRPDSDSVLEQALAILKADGKASYELRGHTDNVGDKAYNQNLSNQRADAVKKWLVAHGIAGSRLATKGFGDSAPIVPNDNDLDRAKNRRVELAKAGCP